MGKTTIAARQLDQQSAVSQLEKGKIGWGIHWDAKEKLFKEVPEQTNTCDVSHATQRRTYEIVTGKNALVPFVVALPQFLLAP